MRGCAVVPGGFRLWEGAAGVLAGVAESAFAPLRRYDPHIPTSASPLGLALAAGEAEVLLMADKARSDLPGLLPAGIRCVTWCTTGVIAAAPGEAVQDRLLLADAAWFAGALRAGWRQEQIAVASWPIVRSESPAGTGLAIIADTVAVEGEPQMELSSHRLLWQAIAADLRKDPLVLGGDAVRYIHEQRERMNIDAAGFDLTRFLGALVIPAYQQSLARVLLEAGVAVRLHGAGWEDIAEFRPHAAGPVRSRDALYAAAAGARALVHVWPERGAHEIDSLGRPVVRPPGRRRESFVREAKAALAGEAGRAREIQGQATLSGALLREVLG